MAIRTISIPALPTWDTPLSSSSPSSSSSTGLKRKRSNDDDGSSSPRDNVLAGLSMTDRIALREVSLSVIKSKKVLVVTGAGISCSAGIPDFRSQDGLYNLLKEKHPKTILTGKDMFSASVFRDPLTHSIFNTFIGTFSLSCSLSIPTPTHQFIRTLATKRKLLRCYTQNVDGLERRMGLDARSIGFDKRGTKVVELHGSVGRVRCGLCNEGRKMTGEIRKEFAEGRAPACSACEDRSAARVRRQSRQITIGRLRPDMVLYDEPHPAGEEIGQIQDHDLRQRPDCLIIMGTSLKVPGLKAMLKDFAMGVHADRPTPARRQRVVGRIGHLGPATGSTTGSPARTQDRSRKVIFVNLDPPTSEWAAFIDIHIRAECDTWVGLVEEDWRRSVPTDWEVQSRLELEAEAGSSGGAVLGEGTAKLGSEQSLKGVQDPMMVGALRDKPKLATTASLQDITNIIKCPTSPPLRLQINQGGPSFQSRTVPPLSPRASISPIKRTPSKRVYADENRSEDHPYPAPATPRELFSSRSSSSIIIPPMTPQASPRKPAPALKITEQPARIPMKRKQPGRSPPNTFASPESDLSDVPDSEQERETAIRQQAKRRKIGKKAAPRTPIGRLFEGNSSSGKAGGMLPIKPYSVASASGGCKK